MKLNEKQKAFLTWETMTHAEYQKHNLPKNLTGIADLIGVDRRTITNWRKRPDWQQLRRAFAAKAMLDFEPEFFKLIRAKLLESDNRSFAPLAQTLSRYILPALHDAEPEIQRIIDSASDQLPQLSETTAKEILKELDPSLLEKVIQALTTLNTVEPTSITKIEKSLFDFLDDNIPLTQEPEIDDDQANLPHYLR